MMQTVVSRRTQTRRESPDTDSFLDNIRKMLENGSIGKMPANLLKIQIVTQVQTYSGELPFIKGNISGTFLLLCDLMVSGRLSKMSPDAFKIYLVLMALQDEVIEACPIIQEELADLAGITDSLAVRSALEALKEEGYVESTDCPVLISKKSSGKKGGQQEGLFLL
jgi:hypothetical protein